MIQRSDKIIIITGTIEHSNNQTFKHCIESLDYYYILSDGRLLLVYFVSDSGETKTLPFTVHCSLFIFQRERLESISKQIDEITNL